MALRDRVRRLRPRMHLPRRTVRLRLALIYGGLFFVAGVVLLTVTYALVHHSTGNIGIVRRPNGGFVVQIRVPPGESRFPTPPPASWEHVAVGGKPPYPAPAEVFGKLFDQQRAVVLHQLVLESGVALGVLLLLSIFLGWLMAGRVLRPLRTMTGTVQTISASNLHERLGMSGPNDEIKELGDTFDRLLGRLEASFEAQRQFVANASHELRTPLARQRTLVEVALGDPQPTVESLQATNQRILVAGEQQERLIEALLTLAQGERGPDRDEPFDLAALTEDVLESRRPEAQRRGLRVESTLQPAAIVGDPGLVERLVANLVDNALEHNVAGGSVWVTTRGREGRAELSVANTGPVVAPEDLARLSKPFQRAAPDRTGHGEGFGLGLSIVRAIAAAHDAEIEIRARPDGGLEVDVAFSLVPREG
jgi:signal transduction histidine kinase